jgi:hypothetical protein
MGPGPHHRNRGAAFGKSSAGDASFNVEARITATCAAAGWSMTAEPVLPCIHHFSPRTGGELIPMLIIFSGAFYICVCGVPMAVG